MTREKFIIKKIKLFVCRDGESVILRELTDEEKTYHQVSHEDIRYCIVDYSGCPRGEGVYTWLTQEECIGVTNYLNPIRKYKNQVDSIYFKFYDDAYEVLKNIRIFIKWIENTQTLEETQQTKRVLKLTRDLMRMPMCHADQTTILPNGLGERRRRELSPKHLSIQNAKDLIK